MMAVDISLAVLLILVCGVATYTDMRHHIIPDWLSLTSLAIGLAVRFGAFGFGGIFDQGLISSFLGAGFAFVLFGLIGLWGKGMGGGDIKLMTAVGALAGFRSVLAISMYAALAGGVLGFGLLLFRRKLLDSDGGVWRGMFVTSTIHGDRVTLPYALPIAIGSLVALVVQFNLI